MAATIIMFVAIFTGLTFPEWNIKNEKIAFTLFAIVAMIALIAGLSI